MKTIIILTISLGLLTACAKDAHMNGMSNNLPVCEMPTTPANCDNSAGGGPAAPQVNFNKNSLNLAPPNVCANKNSVVTFKITPAAEAQNPKGSVAVRAKNPKHTWLVGTNSDDAGEIKITVPDYAVIDEYYEYTVWSNKNGVLECVDPRIHVK